MPGDLDENGVVDAADIDLLRSAVTGSTGVGGGADIHDVNADGVVDPDDFDFLISDIIGTGRGDGNLNKIINFEDLVLISNNYHHAGTGWNEGNVNLDDVTNFEDFVELSNRFGMIFPSEQSVPEVATLSLMAGVLLVLRHHRRQNPALNFNA